MNSAASTDISDMARANTRTTECQALDSPILTTSQRIPIRYHASTAHNPRPDAAPVHGGLTMTHQGQTHSRSCVLRSFSLAELVCVVVIIGILSAIAVPRFSNSIALQRVEAAARRVQVDLALARRHAKTSSTSQIVAFDSAANGYWLEGMMDPDHPSIEYKVSLSEEPYSANIVSVDFGGDEEIIFDGWGAPDNGGFVLVQVGKHQEKIIVDPDTGHASVP